MSIEVTPLDSLSPGQVGAVTDLWKREAREIEATFGGSSMLPTIAPGTPLRIRCDGSADPGDVILFLHRNQLVVHRLLVRRARWMLTRGDANAVADQPAASGYLIGRVTAVERRGTWAPVAVWNETPEQRRFRRIVSGAFAVGAFPVRILVPVLWQLRRFPDAWRRVGAAGVAARIWSRTGGLLFDLDLVSTVALPSALDFELPADFYAQRVSPGAPMFAEAARLLGVDPAARGDQEAYVLIAPDGGIAACSFNDRVHDHGVAHHRGIAVDARFRGRGAGSALFRYQARELASEGATEVHVHIGLTNRASRRMFASMGARPVERWTIVTLLRRFRYAWRRDVEPSK